MNRMLIMAYINKLDILERELNTSINKDEDIILALNMLSDCKILLNNEFINEREFNLVTKATIQIEQLLKRNKSKLDMMINEINSTPDVDMSFLFESDMNSDDTSSDQGDDLRLD